jgi:hypothetical protein
MILLTAVQQGKYVFPAKDVVQLATRSLATANVFPLVTLAVLVHLGVRRPKSVLHKVVVTRLSPLLVGVAIAMIRPARSVVTVGWLVQRVQAVAA